MILDFVPSAPGGLVPPEREFWQKANAKKKIFRKWKARGTPDPTPPREPPA